MPVVEVVEQLGRTSQGLVTYARLVRAGVSRSSLSRALAAGLLVRPARGVYALTELPARPRFLVTAEGVSLAYLTAVRCALLLLGDGAAACGRTAAVLYGWALLVEPRNIEVAVPHGSDLRRAGLTVTQRRTVARSLVRVLPRTTRLRLTSPVQTVLDCCRTLPLLQAVVVCDSALRAGHVTVEQLTTTLERFPGLRGTAAARRVLTLCDPVCGSVLETVLRVHMVLAGLEGFVTQVVLATSPRTVRVDFCFPTARLVIEVDGQRWHQDAARDQERDNLLAMLGWRVLRLSWAQVVHEPEQTLADIRAALAATLTVCPVRATPQLAA